MSKLVLVATVAALASAIVAAPLAGSPSPSAAPGTRLLGWNNLGMHCMDADYGVFSILPPYNTIHAQLVREGRLVRSANGVTVTYEAVADATGSINTTSVGKTAFWTHVGELFGASPAPDTGLAGASMPGLANQPQPMTWDAANDWWIAEGVPITPLDDAGHRNSYPLMRLVARDATGAVIATTDIVLPVSDEMDCRACHASDAPPAARPVAGWAHDPDPQRDYRLNILLRHDDLSAGSTLFADALQSAGYDAAGLHATAVGGRSVLCAACHASNALGTTGFAGVRPLTAAVHWMHASVVDPTEGLALSAVQNRSACYRCHPGATTRCLRGAMGNSVAADGTMAMQCQSCHGTLPVVGDVNRRGWLDEPDCQSCHTGTAVRNAGQIRYANAFDSGIHPRQAADATFATTPDTPAPGLSLFRFSRGHGGLACEACHGSTHAEFPSSHANDNVQSLATQGHVGVLVECAACHGQAPATLSGGPHGMHPVGQSWVERHGDALEGGADKLLAAAAASDCRDCHGIDYRGTVLSKVQADRTVAGFGTHRLFRGQMIGCYECHAGPGSESPNRSVAPTATDASASTQPGVPVQIDLAARDRPGSTLTYRIVSQPAHGTVALLGARATYRPDDAFAGVDTFTFAARDGFVDSNLATVQVSVGTAQPVADLRASWRSLKVVHAHGKTKLRGKIAVANVGAIAAGGSVASIGLSPDGVLHAGDTVLESVSVAALRPGQERRIRVTVKLPAGISTSGGYALVLANADGRVTEANAGNDVAVFGPLP